MRKEVLLTVFVTSVLAVGCVSSRSVYHQRWQHEPADTLAMTMEDVIALSKEGVGDDVIIDQIKATHSSFNLSKDDIIELKNAGVSEAVIRTMIKTSGQRSQRRVVRRYYVSPYYYASPWYPAFWWGFSYRYYRPYYYYLAPRLYWIHRNPLDGGSRSSGRMRR